MSCGSDEPRITSSGEPPTDGWGALCVVACEPVGKHRIIEPVAPDGLTDDEAGDLRVAQQYADTTDLFHLRRVHVGPDARLPDGWAASWSRRYDAEETEPDSREGLFAHGTVSAPSGLMFWFHTTEAGGQIHKIARMVTLDV